MDATSTEAFLKHLERDVSRQQFNGLCRRFYPWTGVLGKLLREHSLGVSEVTYQTLGAYSIHLYSRQTLR